MSKKQFYTLSWTWGFITSFIGLCISIVLLVTKHKPQKWGYSWYFEVGKGGDGFSCGPFFFVGPRASDSTKNHEFGHGIQNTKYGPAMLFIIAASVIRYWYREYLHYVCNVKYSDMPSYDSAWWEGDATMLGTDYITKI